MMWRLDSTLWWPLMRCTPACQAFRAKFSPRICSADKTSGHGATQSHKLVRRHEQAGLASVLRRVIALWLHGAISAPYSGSTEGQVMDAEARQGGKCCVSR